MNAAVGRPTSLMADLMSRIRRAVESFVPWYDPAAAAREHTDVRNEIAKSRATREFARQEMLRGSFGRAGDRLSHR